MLPFLLFFFQNTQLGPTGVSVAVGVLSFAVAAGTNYVVSVKAAARLEGANAEKFNAVNQRLTSHDTELDQLWSKIGSHTGDIGRIEGQLSAIKIGSPKGHHG